VAVEVRQFAAENEIKKLRRCRVRNVLGHGRQNSPERDGVFFPDMKFRKSLSGAARQSRGSILGCPEGNFNDIA
jgi:hypothetical protein